MHKPYLFIYLFIYLCINDDEVASSSIFSLCMRQPAALPFIAHATSSLNYRLLRWLSIVY